MSWPASTADIRARRSVRTSAEECEVGDHKPSRKVGDGWYCSCGAVRWMRRPGSMDGVGR